MNFHFEFFFNRYFVFLVQTRCISGFVGENCRGKCTYLYYSMNCDGQGNCDKERCDLSTGCTNLTHLKEELKMEFSIVYLLTSS